MTIVWIQMNPLKRLVARVSKEFGLHVLSQGEFQEFEEHKRLSKLLNRVHSLGENLNFKQFACLNLVKSSSQSLQDLFALYCHPVGQGFFVEFGASDGQTISNTLMLEKEMGWTGIISEPAQVFRSSLESQRSCSIDFRCVTSRSGEVALFEEHTNPDNSRILTSDLGGRRASSAKVYEVETVSLEDLLKQHHSPKQINFLSIDTEGSEFDILANFDFASFKIEALSIEHNFRSDRQLIHKLLISNGFTQVEKLLSGQDDWYVSRDTFNSCWID